jgi:cytochrome P450
VLAFFSIGKKFAMTEMLTALAMLLQKFEFELVRPDYEWQFRSLALTLGPRDGLPLRLKLRAALG